MTKQDAAEYGMCALIVVTFLALAGLAVSTFYYEPTTTSQE